MKRLGHLALLSAILLPTARAQSSAGTTSWIENLHLTATGTVAVVNNFSRTSFAPTRQDATTYELSLTSTHARQLAPSLFLVATGEFNSLAVPDFDLNNTQRFAARLALQRKFGLGPQAPVLQFSAGATYQDARLKADRGWTTEAGVQLAKRVLPYLRVSAGASWLEHDARSFAFDLNQRTYTADIQWDINDRWSLAGSASRLTGDIVANATWDVWSTMLAGGFGPVVYNYYTSRPWAVANQFGPGWVAYNIEADVDLWSVTLNYALTDHTSVELRKAAAYVVNRVGIAYPTDSWGLSLSHRF